ncbi:hypothetical protein [Sporomusa malonica]|uniref:hypothetical protein n=1 Tax=Sporomusa malonica TaxID=112901 RepID=UPI0015939241|nr:hypothetical protein [Sporomusa malonica]
MNKLPRSRPDYLTGSFFILKIEWTVSGRFRHAGNYIVDILLRLTACQGEMLEYKAAIGLSI